MELIVVDNLTMRNIAIVDVFQSLIWTERYFKCGDFEICTGATTENIELLKHGRYLILKGSDQVMVIEEVQIDCDLEAGQRLLVSGRSLESLLDRRIIWDQTTVDSKIQTAVLKLLNENAINPANANRKIPGLIFETSSDTRLDAIKVANQFTGTNLYEAIQVMCEAAGVGFEIRLNETYQFVFRLYVGQDRSYDQFENPYVIFSPKFENLSESNYLESTKIMKTVALVGGEGEGSERRKLEVPVDSGAGTLLDRREMFVDARDISSKVYENDTERELTAEEYNAQLSQRGKEYLKENEFVKAFEGSVEALQGFRYGTEFTKGDIVQITNEFNLQAVARITEVVRSETVTGYTIYPTFELIDK